MRIRKNLIALLLLLICGCSWKAYIGLHGASVRQYPDIHAGMTADTDCRQCHDSRNSVPERGRRPPTRISPVA